MKIGVFEVDYEDTNHESLQIQLLVELNGLIRVVCQALVEYCE